jgi:hypothetical protein
LSFIQVAGLGTNRVGNLAGKSTHSWCNSSSRLDGAWNNLYKIEFSFTSNSYILYTHGTPPNSGWSGSCIAFRVTVDACRRLNIFGPRLCINWSVLARVHAWPAHRILYMPEPGTLLSERESQYWRQLCIHRAYTIPPGSPSHIPFLEWSCDRRRCWKCLATQYSLCAVI